MEKVRAIVIDHLDLVEKGYKVLLLQVGASTQFLIVALYFLEKRSVYLNTDTRSYNAITDARI